MTQAEIKELANKLFVESYENRKELFGEEPDQMAILIAHDIQKELPEGWNVDWEGHDNGTYVVFLRKKVCNIGAIIPSQKKQGS